MKLREREPSPEVQRELAAIDAALDGKPVDADLRDLATLATELQADRPQLSPDLGDRLDQLVASGFADTQEAAGPPSPISERLADRFGAFSRRLLPVMAAGTTAIVVIGVAIGQSGGGSQGGLDGSGAAGGAGGQVQTLDKSQPENPSSAPGQPQASGGGGASGSAGSAEARRSSSSNPKLQPSSVPPVSAQSDSPAISQPPFSGDTNARPGRDRVQETSASLTLSARLDEVQDVADGVVSVTDRYHGFVEGSTVNVGEHSGRANFSLRIPSANLQAALSDLSDLGHVVSRNEGSADITGSFVSAGERFKDARAAVRRILEQLETAVSASEIAALRQQLSFARSELASARSQLRQVKQRAALSTVTVAITSAGDGPGWSIGDAADDAVGVLEALAGAALVTLAVLVPLGALLAGAWYGTAGVRRRRRESGLS